MTGTNEVRAGYRTCTLHDTLHGNYPLPCPFCFFSPRRALCAAPLLLPPPLPLPSSVHARCRAMRSLSPVPLVSPPSLPQLSGLLTSPVCPTSLALPVPSSLVPACPRCIKPSRHAAHCTFEGGLPCGTTPRRSALSSAPARCGQPARLLGPFLILPLVRSFKPPWDTMLVREQLVPFPALPSLTLCPPASASTVRSNLRGNAPYLPPLSAPAPWARPAPCLLTLSHLALPLFPGCRVSGLLPLRSLHPSTPPACTVQRNVRGNSPTPPLPFCPVVSRSRGKLHALCTAPPCGLYFSSLPSLAA